MLAEKIKRVLRNREVIEGKNYAKGQPPPSTEKYDHQLTSLIKQSSNQPKECLKIQHAMIQHEYNRQPLTHEREMSLSKAWNSLLAAEKIVDLIDKSPQKYMKQAEVHFLSRDMQIKGLPKDAMRIFCNGHIARLTNERKAYVQESRAKLIDTQRLSIMKTRDNYAKIQKVVMAKSKVKLPDLTRNTSLVL